MMMMMMTNEYKNYELLLLSYCLAMTLIGRV